MASELLKNRALIQKLKEPEVPRVKFDLASTGFEELFTLPEPKPQELLDIQEDVRIQRQQDTMDKARPFLMDESVDFIERENFARGSFKPNISIFEDIVLKFNQGSEYKNVKDVFEEYYKITKDPFAKNQAEKGVTRGSKAEKLIRPVLSLLETPEEKVNRVFTEALSTDTPVDISVVDRAKVKVASRASVWRANIADKTDLDQNFVNKILNKNPDYIKNKKLFDYLGQSQLLLTDLKDLPLKDQLAYADEALKGRPVYTGITRKGQNKLMRDPAHKVMEFALRNFIANEGKGAVKFFDKNGKPVKYKTGLKIPYRNSIISYKGKKHTVADLRKPGYMQKFFPNVYDNQIKINKILNQEIDNPFKKGKKINFGDFMTEVQVKAYGWAPRAGSIDILHGPDGVKGDPFDNLTFGTKRLNYQLEDINKLYRFGKIDDASRLKLLDAAEGKLKGLQGDELLNAIVKQQVGIANQIKKGKTFGTTRQETEKLIKKTGITPTKKLSALRELSSRVGSGVDPALAARAVKEQFVDPLTSRVPTGKGIKALSTAGKIALPETYFAPASIVLDTYAGRTPKEMVGNILTLGAYAPALDAYKKAQQLKDLGLLSDYKKAMAKIIRADQALAEEVETLGMDTPAEEFAEPQFTVGEQIAALAGMEEDKKLSERLEEKAAEYQKLREDQLKKGLLEVTPEGEELPEDVGIQPEIPLEEEEEEEKSLGVFDRITGNIPRDFMSKGGIMATRLGFSSGTGPFPLRMMFMIKDRMQNLKNSTFSNYNDVFRMGEQKGIKNILEPYKNIPDKNKLITVLEDIDELKKIMPEEYRSILDDIANDTKQFNFKTAKDRTDALAETIPSDMDFKKLSDELFPMPNPENPSFILLGPDSPVSAGRYSTTTTIDKFTGKGKRQVYDTFDEETGEFTRPGKLVEEEPLEEEYSEFIRDMDKPDETN